MFKLAVIFFLKFIFWMHTHTRQRPLLGPLKLSAIVTLNAEIIAQYR